MQDETGAHGRDRFACDPDTREHRLRREIGLIGRAVCRLDAGSLTRRASARPDGAIAVRRRRPFDLRDCAAGLRDGVAEGGKANVEHLGLLAEQIHGQALPALDRQARRRASVRQFAPQGGPPGHCSESAPCRLRAASLPGRRATADRPACRRRSRRPTGRVPRLPRARSPPARPARSRPPDRHARRSRDDIEQDDGGLGIARLVGDALVAQADGRSWGAAGRG